jgi:hypothetical protein
MQEYEIHILQDEKYPSVLTARLEDSDRAAIQSARRMALGRQFEVWRGTECITGLAHLLPPPDS